MLVRRIALLVVAISGAVTFLHCVSDDPGAAPPSGAIGQPCYTDHTCMSGLQCLDAGCVPAAVTTADGGTTPANDSGGDQAGRVAGCPVDPANKRAFLTSGAYPLGQFTNGAPGNASAVCQAHAKDAGLTGIWKGWISDNSQNAIDILTVGARYVTLDGKTLFDSPAALATAGADAGIDAGIDIDERCFRTTPTGEPNAGREVWTGTGSDGEVSNDCQNWTTTGSSVKVGKAGQAGPGWTAAGTAACDATRPIYCFER